MISMNEIPANLRVPLFYMEFDNSGAVRGGATQEYRTLIVGNKLPGGTAQPLSLNRITSVAQAEELFGVGSVLADMIAAALDLNKIHPMYAVPLADNVAGVQATGTLTFTGPATKSGIINLLIGGRLIQVGVTAGDTAATIATAAAAAINADAKALVTASAAAAVVTVTAKNKGEHGNGLDLRDSHYEGQVLPAGVGITYAAMSGGAGNPDVATVWPVIGDDQYLITVSPWTDTVNVGKVETEFKSRFGPMKADEGMAFYGLRGTFGTLVTYGGNRNSPFSVLMPVRGPTNPWAWAARVAAQVALAASIDPARPFGTLELGVIAPKKTEEFTLEERNQLLYSGISTFKVANGETQIEMLITSFQKNSFGSPDTSYHKVNTVLTLSYLRFDLKARITSKYPRHKLADDGARVAPGQAIVTPKVIKAEIVTKFREWEEKGLVEGVDQFKAQLIVERNADNPNRVDVLMPPDLVNQFDVLAIKNQFLL